MFVLAFILFSFSSIINGYDRVCSYNSDDYNTRDEIKNLVPVAYNFNGQFNGSASLYINNATYPAPIQWLQIAILNGYSIQTYNSSLGTLQGDFYIQIGPNTFFPAAHWQYKMDPVEKWSSARTHCLLPDLRNAITSNYIRGDILSNNLLMNVYIANKALNSTQLGSIKHGQTYGIEWYNFFTPEQSLNIQTQMSTTSPTAASQLCFTWIKVADESSLKREDSFFNKNTIVSESKEKHTHVGKVKIPKSLIPKQWNSKFVFN